MDLERLDALLTAEGRELVRLITDNAVGPAGELALNTRLRRTYDPDLVAAAFALVELRARGAAKFSRASEMYFTRAGLEQATSEVVALHRAVRFSPFCRVADLCVGLGGDLIGLAPGRDVLAVDLDPLHVRLAELNAGVYGLPVPETRVEDVRNTNLAGIEAAFLDPARRSAGAREFDPERGDPPLSWGLALAGRVGSVAIKCAPGLGLDAAPSEWEVEFVSLNGDLKEATLWSPALAAVTRRATLLPSGHELLPVPGPPIVVRPPGRYLLDPDPAVTRSGLVEDLARLLDAWKIDERVAFLSSDAPLITPFGRCLVVEDSAPWGLKALRATLRRLNVGSVDVRKRGSAVDVDDLRRRLRLTGGGRATVALTRSQGRPWALVCTDLPADTVKSPFGGYTGP